MNRREEVVVDYVAYRIANNEEVAQKYYDYLEKQGLLALAVKKSKEI